MCARFPNEVVAGLDTETIHVYIGRPREITKSRMQRQTSSAPSKEYSTARKLEKWSSSLSLSLSLFYGAGRRRIMHHDHAASSIRMYIQKYRAISSGRGQQTNTTPLTILNRKHTPLYVLHTVLQLLRVRSRRAVDRRQNVDKVWEGVTAGPIQMSYPIRALVSARRRIARRRGIILALLCERL